MEQRVKQELVDILGPDKFSDHLIDLVSYATDASINKRRPAAAAWATSTAEVSAILKLASREGFAVTVRGAGTGLTGLAVPMAGGLVLDMGRMNRIKRISIPDRLAVVEPGVVYADLAKALAPQGFAFPPDPASGKACTIGGNVATNAGGVKGAKYGTTKDYVLGLEVVLADGRVLHTGSNCMKSVSGYDLTRLFVGSEGTLGVITEITLKISPQPGRTATALATFDDVEDAGRAVSSIMASGIIPSVLEIIDRSTLEVINQYTDLNLPEVAAMLLVETEGYTEGEAQFQIEKIIAIFQQNQALEVRQAHREEEVAALWAARKSSYAAAGRINNSLLVEDLSVPMSQVAAMLRAVDQLAQKYNLKIATVGHAGDGNLHPTICFDGTDAEEVARVHQASEELFKKVLALGGTLTGEHGIGMDKARFMCLEHDEVSLQLMASLKNLLDPLNILNPGKMALGTC